MSVSSPKKAYWISQFLCSWGLRFTMNYYFYYKNITCTNIYCWLSKWLAIKGNLGCPTIQSWIRVFLNLCLHQQLKFDNSLYIVHTRSDLFSSFNFLRAAILKCDIIALQCQPPTYSLLLFLSGVETGTKTHTSHFKMVNCRNSMVKTNRLVWTLYRELSTLSFWCRHKSRKTLICDRYC